jgi:hypothetical protein
VTVVEPLTVVEQLAEFAVARRATPLAESVRHAAVRATVDWVSATVPGSCTRAARALTETLDPGPGPARLIPSGRATDVRTAALLNGSAAHAAEHGRPRTESIADEVTTRLTTLVQAITYGDPRAAGTQVGPLIDTPAARRAQAMLEDAVGHGSRLLTGGARAGAMIAPALLAGLPDSARLAAEEAFAPLVAVSPVGSLDEAARRANATRYGLQAGVFCQDLDVALAFTRLLDTGGVIINDTSSCHPDPMPYGGVKDSGQGVEGPGYAVPDMTDSRTVLIRHRPPSPA